MRKSRGEPRLPVALLRGALVPVPLAEPLHAARSVHQLLLAGEVRVTRRADLDLDARLGRPRLQRIAAGAVDDCLLILRMNVRLHDARLFPVKSGPAHAPGRPAALSGS